MECDFLPNLRQPDENEDVKEEFNLDEAIFPKRTTHSTFDRTVVENEKIVKEASDLRLEVGSLNDKVDKLQKDGIKTGIIRGAISALVGGVVSAVVIGIVLKVRGLPSAP